MKIFIVGGTGFIGTSLIPALLKHGHEIHALVRPGSRAFFPNGVLSVRGDGCHPGKWQDRIEGKDMVINLAGSPVVPPWTKKLKQTMRDSRVLTTRNVVSAMSSAQFLINASAIGYYGFRGDEALSEESGVGEGFLASVCKAWEAEALLAACKGARVMVARFGVVLGFGGVLEDLARMLQNFLGSRLGSGQQWFSWIHIEDLIEAILFYAEKNPSGTYNICSANPVRNQELMRAVAKLLKRSSSLPIPAMLIKVVLGEFADVVLKGQRVFPVRLQEDGFRFHYPLLNDALEHLLKGLAQ